MATRHVGLLQPLPLQIVRPGASLVRQGESADAWVVEAGLFRAWTVDDHGRELVLDVLGPGDLVGEAGGALSPWTITALGPGRLRVAPPDMLGSALAERAERLTSLSCQLAWLGVCDRIEVRLGELARRLGRPVPVGLLLPLRLTQAEVASLVGTSRESANRAIRFLLARDRLRIERRGRYVIPRHLSVVP